MLVKRETLIGLLEQSKHLSDLETIDLNDVVIKLFKALDITSLIDQTKILDLKLQL